MESEKLKNLLLTHLNIVSRSRFLFTSTTCPNPPAVSIPIMHSVTRPVSIRMR